MAVVLLSFLSCTGTDESAEQSVSTYEQLKAFLENEDVLLLDVRTYSEYLSGTIPGAVNRPFDTLETTPPEWDKDKPIVVFCRSGSRSAVADRFLRQHGFEQVYDFGGINRWQGELEMPESQ